MSTSRPTVSVVVPTRNRAPLLQRTLAALGALRGDDIEILVSDNRSTDATRRVLRSVDDARLRVVEPPQPLGAVDHWEFAVAQARGEWVTVLGDDDALVPALLDVVGRDLSAGRRVVAWQKAWYVHPDLDPAWPDPDEENVLYVEPWTGCRRDVSARDELVRFFRRQERRERPEMNALVHRDVLDEIRRRADRVFRGPDPAVGMCAAVLAVEASYLAVEAPLTVMGLSASSISTAVSRRLTLVHDVVREYEAGDGRVGRVPLASRCLPNLVAETLAAVKDSLPNELDGIDLDPVAYYVTCREAMGDADVAEWRRCLRSEPAAVRRAVRATLRSRGLRTAARRAVHSTPVGRRLVARVRGGAGERARLHIVEGGSAGFSDLAGA
ncbi:MAG TPA: glycosyltransferase family A protein, partial [Acidimicrobiia bacterium]|nr:glycosyltransferase family A protein [Acidimicrobiia bacterium]